MPEKFTMDNDFESFSLYCDTQYFWTVQLVVVFRTSIFLYEAVTIFWCMVPVMELWQEWIIGNKYAVVSQGEAFST